MFEFQFLLLCADVFKFGPREIFSIKYIENAFFEGELNNGGYIIEHYNQQSPRNFSCSAWNKLNREMSPKKTPPRAHVVFDEVELNSIQIQGDTQLTKGSVLNLELNWQILKQ